MGIDALISIGGDDTLKTANKFKLFQEQLPPGSKRIPVVHLPKTIDNDYSGIDFTFGYFTAVEVLAGEIRNLLADAEATRSYFIAETMGRSAGWLAYGAAIAGEASLVISVEDITGKYEASEETTDPQTGKTDDPPRDGPRRSRQADRGHDARPRGGRRQGVRRDRDRRGAGRVPAPSSTSRASPATSTGTSPSRSSTSAACSPTWSAKEYTRQTGKKRKITGLQLGYECRCARPQAFDVMLGSQLGVGAYRALVEKRLDGVMVSVSGQLELNYVPFSQLVDPATLVTVVRYIEPGSDFHRLARFLETYVNE